MDLPGGSTPELNTNMFPLLEKSIQSYLGLNQEFCKVQSQLFLLLHCGKLYFAVLDHNV
jgi:hypothetical protein